MIHPVVSFLAMAALWLIAIALLEINETLSKRMESFDLLNRLKVKKLTGLDSYEQAKKWEDAK